MIHSAVASGTGWKPVLLWGLGGGPRGLLALGEGGLGTGEVGRDEAGVDFHRAPGVGQGLGGFALAHEGVGKRAFDPRDQLLAVDGFG